MRERQCSRQEVLIVLMVLTVFMVLMVLLVSMVLMVLMLSSALMILMVLGSSRSSWSIPM